MTVIEISPKEAFAILEQFPDAKLVDVRTQEEWQEKPTAALSNLQQLIKLSLSEDFGEKLCEIIPEPHTKVLFICARGVRSKTAAMMMQKLGYINSYNITGGIYDWYASKLPYFQK
jgi:rhodanese-related sulfurtransferase